ncbi:hypothetical protein CI109_101078 [Kwoniella shandongensis]|uniref:Uncharacterized protein n=1 Tax=Kwoniella shandongensis TaxID=1734106 RepID=A0A5M6C5T3_9TREE|nr:uncharacterized protein CI109_001547 [Kwoniella shandongensis]KAA5530141.1 hypothetical protein CI109_001547 [Kwoniella shandongensis]
MSSRPIKSASTRTDTTTSTSTGPTSIRTVDSRSVYNPRQFVSKTPGRESRLTRLKALSIEDIVTTETVTKTEPSEPNEEVEDGEVGYPLRRTESRKPWKAHFGK